MQAKTREVLDYLDNIFSTDPCADELWLTLSGCIRGPDNESNTLKELTKAVRRAAFPKTAALVGTTAYEERTIKHPSFGYYEGFTTDQDKRFFDDVESHPERGDSGNLLKAGYRLYHFWHHVTRAAQFLGILPKQD